MRRLLLLFFVGSSVLGQTLRPNDPLQERHVLALRAERTEAFLTAWEEAPAELRRRVEEVLVDLRGPGAPLARRPDLRHLAVATRVLRGADPQEAKADRLAAFADALDLQVVPGLFEASAQGRGSPLTVQVHRALRSSWSETVELSLIWVGPEGREIRARTEPIAAERFAAPGFPMYVRSPLSGPCTWRLVPEVAWRGARARGRGVRVEAVADLARLREAVREAGRGAELDALLAHGIRPTHGLPPSRWTELALDTGSAPGPVSGFPAGWHAWGVPRPMEAGCDLLLVLAPTGEAAEALFRPPTRRRWLQLAEERRLGVVSLELPLPDAARLPGVLRSLEEGGAVHVVARGDAIAVLHLAFAAGAAPVDGFVLSAPIAAPGAALPDEPTLLVTGAEPRVVEGRATPLQLVPGHRLPLLDELELAPRIGRWLESLAARR